MKYRTKEFWVALIGAIVALGVIGADFPVDDTAEMIVGVIGGILALSDTLGLGSVLSKTDAE